MKESKYKNLFLTSYFSQKLFLNSFTCNSWQQFDVRKLLAEEREERGEKRGERRQERGEERRGRRLGEEDGREGARETQRQRQRDMRAF